MNGNNETVAKSMLWKTLEHYAALAAQLMVQIVLARILEPDQFGLLSMMTVFTSIATVFIQNGFNMALVQKKEASENDCSTALYINIAIGLVIYGIIFIFAPSIATYYEQPQITLALRVLAITLLIGSVTSIQIAIATRNMKFRMMFFINFIAAILSGALGIVFAVIGFGVWALIIQQISLKVITFIGFFIGLKWRPNLAFEKDSAKTMFSFGSKLLLAGMINQIYDELNNLVIGKKYTSSDLAYYYKGRQFPMYLTTGIDSSIKSVMFSAFSKKQSSPEQLHEMLRKTISVNTYLVFPLMVGLAVAAEPFTVFLLTEKWLFAVPYMRVCCLIYAIHPIVTAHLQALAAIGRSDIRLRLEFIKKPIGVALLIVAVLLDKGPFAIACSTALTAIISLFVNVIVSKIYIKLSFKAQVIDILPSLLMSLVMGGAVYFLNYIPLSASLLLLIELCCGVVIYFVLSALFKPVGYSFVMSFIQKALKRKKAKSNEEM